MNQLLPGPHPALEACVIVPAKNEAATLPVALQALASQVDRNGSPLPPERWEVFLLINNSIDDSFSVAQSFRQSHPDFPLRVAQFHFPAEQAHIGHVRKWMMDAACERLAVRPKGSSLILSTDGDSEVAPDWIARNREEAADGAEAIGGRIALQVGDLFQLDSQTRNIQGWNDQYQLLISWLEDRCDPQAHDPWPRHHQHFGSSLAVRPEIYRQVGGIPPHPALEDVAFYEALARQDVKIRHSPVVRVRTSGRLEGRTTVGLAEQLSRWSRGSSAMEVPSVHLFETLFSLRRRVRVLWQRLHSAEKTHGCAGENLLENVAAACGTRPGELAEALQSKWFGSAFESLNVRKKLENGLLAGEALQSLPEALGELQMRFRATRRPYREFFVEEVQSGIAAL